jgi:hypothetical protein
MIMLEAPAKPRIPMRSRFVILAGLLVAAGLGTGWYWVGGSGQQAREPPDVTEPAMSEEQREYIWQVEHHVLVLSKHWFNDFAQALKNADGTALATALAADFKGRMLGEPAQEERLDAPYAQLVRRKDAGAPPVSLDRQAFVAKLLEYRRPFVSPPQVKLYPKMLAPQRRGDLDSPWQGAGVLRMWGAVGPGKPAEVVLRLELDLPRPRDQAQTGWLKTCAITQTQVARAPRFLLRDATRERGIDPDQFFDNWVKKTNSPSTGGIYLCDFNRDGITDVLVTDVQCLVLYQGLPDGNFKDVTAAMGLLRTPPPSPSFVVAGFVDIDGDGWEDLIAVGEIYRNEGGKRFVNCTGKTNLRIPQEATGLSFVDYDGDGRMDVYVTAPGKTRHGSWLDGKSGDIKGNQLWRNLGDWKFKDVTKESNTAGGERSVFSAVWFDANNDGKPDVYVPNEFGNGVLLLNNGDGSFRERMIMSGPLDFGTMGITCGDINNDGYTDLYLANMYSKTGSRIVGNVAPGTYSEKIMATMRRFVAGSQLHLNNKDLQFKPVAEEWQMNDVGWAYGPALVDLDNDGFLDLFASSGYISVSRDEPDG